FTQATLMPSTTTTSSLVTPSLEQREVIALLIIVGQQFDQFKHFVWPDSDLRYQTIYTALKTVRKFLLLNDYVPPNRRCVVMEKCLQYSGQLEKIYRLIGKDKIHFAGDLDVKQMMEEAKLFYVPRKYDEAQHISFPHNFIHTCLQTGDRDPIKWGSAGQLSLRAAVRIPTVTPCGKQIIQVQHLSQPDYIDYCVETRESLTREEPTRHTTVSTRPPRKRRFSELAIDVDCRPVMKTQSHKFACYDIANNNKSKDATFWELPKPAFIHYCRASERDMKERWACSLNLHHQWNDKARCDISRIHHNCVSEVCSDSLSTTQGFTQLYQKRNYREFVPIMNGLVNNGMT
ncbi:hypothetical protein PRIPAC_97031, partial [Pristionchus pacificus]|uniref:Uncharacterized protein n=1 Tax=Pristionchus pacificus TaxID=54126 RepID=A0A2A6BDM3_PRIPA